MVTRDAPLVKKVKLERLALIKERYQKLIVRQRQEIEKELQDDFKHEEEYDPEIDTTTTHEEELED